MTDFTDLTQIPKNTYEVVYVDCPWEYYGSKTKWAAAAKFYPLMKDEELLQLPVVSLMAPRSVMFMWATSPRLDMAVRLIESWGLTYRGVAFVWVKTRQDGGIIGAQGVRPSIVKPTTEFVLAASRTKKGRPLPLQSEAIAQVVLAPRQEHSKKPAEVRQRIESLFAPEVRRLELFARGLEVPGWDRFGNELER